LPSSRCVGEPLEDVLLMNKSAIVGTSLLCVALAGGAGFWFGAQRAKAPTDATTAAAPAKGMPSGGAPMTVEATKVARQSLPQMITAVGSLRSDESVTLRPEVAGRVDAILFKEGQNVSKGMTLVRLDPAINKAEVQQAKANLVLAKSKYDRAVELSQRNFISGQAKDEAENNLRVAESAVALVEARLAKTEIKAPFSGVIGPRVVSVGDYVKEGADMVNLESIDPLKVDFRVPETYMRQVQPGQTLTVTLDALPGKSYEATVTKIAPASITPKDKQVDVFPVEATLTKADALIKPGMTADVRIHIEKKEHVLILPIEAVVKDKGKQMVTKVVPAEKGKKQVETEVKVGARNDREVEITDGLKEGDEVMIKPGSSAENEYKM
jgi:membrane fusion protein (multidrug efflux system)